MDARSLLSPVRAPTELADERSAISTDLSDATSSLSTSQLNGSSVILILAFDDRRGRPIF